MTEYRKNLPHFHKSDQPIFVTWRLAGSLPVGRVFPPELTGGRKFVAVDRLLDGARTGPMFLRQPEVADTVMQAIVDSDGRWDPHAFVLMPNHVHLLVTPHIEAQEMLRRIKGRSARLANKVLSRTGQEFWQHESYDHLVRDVGEFDRIRRYIEVNPVRAGLVADPADFPFLRS